MSILDTIVEHKYKEVQQLKQQYDHLTDKDLTFNNPYSLIDTIEHTPLLDIIAEIKRGSPSKGLFAKDLDYISQAKLYEQNRVSCISVLTDTTFFYGGYHILQEIRQVVSCPLLLKDFVIDDIQIKLAKYFGANVVLLIKKILPQPLFIQLLNTARFYKLEVLVEVESESEFEAIKHLDFQLCGVNNRNLHNFAVDINKTIQLADRVIKAGKTLISESGINHKEQLLVLRKHGVSGVLIGESVIKNPALLSDFKVKKTPVEVKICGITAVDHAVAIEKLGAEYIGLVFAESRRKIALEVASQICQKLSTSQSVGVFLNQNAKEINSIYKTCQLDYVQIHGDTEFELLDIPTDRIIKAISYNDKHPTRYDFLLIDGTLPGSGETYTLKDIHLIDKQVYILAGGITSENVKERINDFNFKIVDISSGVETDGIKDIKKVETFIHTVRSI